MKRLFLLAALAVGVSSFAYESFEPCQYWRYDFNSSTYTCQNTAFRIQVYTAQEVQQIVNTLERRIQDLESRLAKVEQKLP